LNKVRREGGREGGRKSEGERDKKIERERRERDSNRPKQLHHCIRPETVENDPD
jgi:hypothetical protein